ncbi:MAG: thiolase family protein [Thermoplasmatota archaeon]
MESHPHDAVILSAVRTPVGKFQGALASMRAPDLGALVVREALARARVAPEAVDEVVMGNVLTAGVGQNPARQAALGAGLPNTIPAMTVNKVCGSSLKAVALAAQSIKAGDASLVVAGGQESMTNAPFLLPGARSGLRLGDAKLIDSLQFDGLLDIYSRKPMGETGEIVAEEFSVTRKEADELALASQRNAAAATATGWFKDEILPVTVRAGKEERIVTRDEGIRADASMDALENLKPVFRATGVVTAGNSSQISDGASALVVASRAKADELGLRPLARIAGYHTSGVAPERVMAAPIPGVKALLAKLHLGIADIDLFEHNEAFATASCAVRAQLAVPHGRFNVEGGAIALGHPIGASGARILTTLLYALKRTGGHRGLATLCLGGGNAVQMVIERE